MFEHFSHFVFFIFELSIFSFFCFFIFHFFHFSLFIFHYLKNCFSFFLSFFFLSCFSYFFIFSPCSRASLKHRFFLPQNLHFKARFLVREEERRKKKEERADRNRSPSTIARTGTFVFSRAWNSLTPTSSPRSTHEDTLARSKLLTHKPNAPSSEPARRSTPGSRDTLEIISIQLRCHTILGSQILKTRQVQRNNEHQTRFTTPRSKRKPAA